MAQRLSHALLELNGRFREAAAVWRDGVQRDYSINHHMRVEQVLHEFFTARDALEEAIEEAETIVRSI